MASARSFTAEIAISRPNAKYYGLTRSLSDGAMSQTGEITEAVVVA